MQHLSNIFHIPAILLMFLLFSCSKGEGIIPQKAMVNIIGEMYLADQYVEEHPTMRAQMDTLVLYEAVTMRHGYTFKDYCNSVQYYLTKGDALKNIHIKARKQLLKQRDELDEQISKANPEPIPWWGEDTIATKHVNALWKEPYLRNLKWLANYEADQEWKFTDTTTFDIPQNILWWNNTLLSNTKKSPADSLYPILQRDYLIWKDNSSNQPGTSAHSTRIVKPDLKKFNKRKEMERLRNSRK